MSEPTLDTLDIHTKEEYVRRGYPWKEWDLLRREAPVFWYERDGLKPFWAITRHADILTVSKHDEVFVKVLGSPRETFNKLKPWKQTQLKKAAGLW